MSKNIIRNKTYCIYVSRILEIIGALALIGIVVVGGVVVASGGSLVVPAVHQSKVQIRRSKVRQASVLRRIVGGKSQMIQSESSLRLA
jgi:hypothetical protein